MNSYIYHSVSSLIVACCLFGTPPIDTCAVAQDNSTRYDSYKGLVIAGYQGWFNTPEDGAGKQWTHYGLNNKFEPGHCSIDFWPDMSEYEKSYDTQFKFANGSTATVFSSYDPSTIDLHFRWMKEYGVDGVFMQRFIHKMQQKRIENHYDKVFDSAIKSAKKYDRVLSIRYDLTGMPQGYSEVLLRDLDKLNAKYDFFSRRKCPTFLHHDGKPLIAIGGVGFRKDIAGADDVGYLKEAVAIIEGLRKRGYCIMMRVPAQWRVFRGTAVVDEPHQRKQFHNIIKTCDILMPWHVGAFREGSYLKGNWPEKIADDMQWCHSNKIEYVPVVYPGFSRANLKEGEDGSFRPRNNGAFYWLQASHAIEKGAKMIFVAQFDEMDEGTQIFKCTHEVPLGRSPFIAYEKDVKTDHYLWLTGKMGEMLRNEMSFTKTVPNR